MFFRPWVNAFKYISFKKSVSNLRFQKENKIICLLSLFFLQVCLLILAWTLVIFISGDSFRYIDRIKYHSLTLVALTLLLMPIVEESIFRYWIGLKSQGFFYMILSFGLVTSIYLSGNWKTSIIMAIVLFGIALASGEIVINMLHGKIDNLIPLYGNAIIFSGFHLSNYRDTGVLNLLYIFPQFVSGVILAIIRLRISLLGAVLAHFAWHLIIVMCIVVTLFV